MVEAVIHCNTPNAKNHIGELNGLLFCTCASMRTLAQAGGSGESGDNVSPTGV